MKAGPSGVMKAGQSAWALAALKAVALAAAWASSLATVWAGKWAGARAAQSVEVQAAQWVLQEYSASTVAYQRPDSLCKWLVHSPQLRAKGCLAWAWGELGLGQGVKVTRGRLHEHYRAH